MKPRNLLLSTSLGLGGADRQILYLAETLLAHDYDVRLVSMTPVGEMGRQAAANGLPITSLDMEAGHADWRALRRLVSLLRDWRPHLLTTFMYHANLMGRVAGRWAGVPHIITSIRSERNGSAARDWLFRLTNWMDHRCTTNSEEVAASLWKRGLLSREKLTVIPNGVDLATFSVEADEAARLRGELGLTCDQFAWLAVGRLREQKDYPTLLNAFQQLGDTSGRLLIAGRGPLQGQLQQLTDRLGMARQVTFLGVREDIPALLAAADGFVLSSAWEGMPNVVMEALAAARPVVATRVGGVTELVEQDQSGLLVPPRDPSALSQAMRQVMSLSLEQRRRMGLRGRQQVATHYTLAAMAGRWMGLYQDLLKQPLAGSRAAE